MQRNPESGPRVLRAGRGVFRGILETVNRPLLLLHRMTGQPSNPWKYMKGSLQIRIAFGCPKLKIDYGCLDCQLCDISQPVSGRINWRCHPIKTMIFTWNSHGSGFIFSETKRIKQPPTSATWFWNLLFSGNSRFKKNSFFSVLKNWAFFWKSTHSLTLRVAEEGELLIGKGDGNLHSVEPSGSLQNSHELQEPLKRQKWCWTKWWMPLG